MTAINWKEIPNVHLIPQWFPDPALQEFWENGRHYREGGTQPWVQSLLYHLVRACGYRRVVELGTWTGLTTAWLAHAVQANGGGKLYATENVPAMADTAAARLYAAEIPDVDWFIRKADTLEALQSLPFEPQFVFLDDDKIDLAKKFAFFPGALVAVHDAEDCPELKAFPHLYLPTAVLHGSGHLALLRV
jgi:predicted O-methyltransferase YrrM